MKLRVLNRFINRISNDLAQPSSNVPSATSLIILTILCWSLEYIYNGLFGIFMVSLVEINWVVFSVALLQTYICEKTLFWAHRTTKQIFVSSLWRESKITVKSCLYNRYKIQTKNYRGMQFKPRHRVGNPKSWGCLSSGTQQHFLEVFWPKRGWFKKTPICALSSAQFVCF